MAKKVSGAKTSAATGGSGGASVPASRESSSRATAREDARPTSRLKPSALLDTPVVYCGDNLEQLAKLPVQEILDEQLAKKLV